MAKMKTQISNYQEASAFLGGELERELGYRTVVHRLELRDSIAVRYIDTDIVIFDRDGDIEFDTNGWHTTTTKQRLSNIIPDVLVWSEGADKWGFPIWAISAPEGADARFEDGMYLRNNSFDHWKRNRYDDNS
tara:strand:+ start:1384 stop:1782 length:399 start_codon:yes stop_codon:yes gene_type:complete